MRLKSNEVVAWIWKGRLSLREWHYLWCKFVLTWWYCYGLISLVKVGKNLVYCTYIY